MKLSEITNKREILQLKKSSEDELGIPTFIYPYDRRAIQAIRRDQRPLAQTAAKSVLRAEMQSHLQACENRVQLKAR
jgi:ABC-type phosphate/phosphonate transport system substrate-binding protein